MAGMARIRSRIADTASSRNASRGEQQVPVLPKMQSGHTLLPIGVMLKVNLAEKPKPCVVFVSRTQRKNPN